MARPSDHTREELKELALKSAETLLNNNSASELSTRQITKTSRVLWSSVHGICTLSVNNNLFAESACSSQALIESLISNFISGWTAEK